MPDNKKKNEKKNNNSGTASAGQKGDKALSCIATIIVDVITIVVGMTLLSSLIR